MVVIFSMQKCFRYCFFWLILFLFITSINAQEYDSTYTLSNNTQGHAEFEYYYDIDHLMVKNGEFKFRSDSTKQIAPSIFEDVQIEGNYSENSKSKAWLYQLTRKELDILNIADDSINYELRTYKSEIKGSYTRGLPSGQWTMTTILSSNYQETKEYQNTVLSFKRGYADGAFEHSGFGENDSPIAISGQFDQGIFVGDWQFDYTIKGKKINEIRHYEKGVLEYAVINSDTLFYPLSPKTQAALYENENHLITTPVQIDYNDGFPTASEHISSQQPGNIVLKGLQNTLFQFDKDLLAKQQTTFGVSRVRYPLSEEEQKSVSEWGQVEEDFRDKVTEVKEHEIRDFGVSRDSIAIISLDWINQQEELLESLSDLSQILLSGDAEYYYRDGLLLSNAIDILKTDTLTYEKNQYLVDYPTSTESQKMLLPFLVANYRSRIAVADRLDEYLSTLKTSSTLEEELASLPDQIQIEKEKIDSLYSESYTEKTKEFLTQVSFNFIKPKIENDIERFEDLEESEDKKSLGDSILIDLNSLSRIHQTALRIEQRTQFVDSLYTEYMFDAFTFSDIQARVKKKLYEQIEDIQKELLNEAIEAEYPKECLDLLEEVYKVQGALISLREKKTRPLERSLARASNLSEKLALLHEEF